MASEPDPLGSFSDVIRFADVSWSAIPDAPGVYVIYDHADVLYVGMAGRDGAGSLRKCLKAHSSGQVVNMFAQYLFLSRVQFVAAERVTHPRDAKVACRAYILKRCSLAVPRHAERGRSACSGELTQAPVEAGPQRNGRIVWLTIRGETR